jgi:hypothetical protein
MVPFGILSPKMFFDLRFVGKLFTGGGVAGLGLGVWGFGVKTRAVTEQEYDEKERASKEARVLLNKRPCNRHTATNKQLKHSANNMPSAG